MDIDINYFKFLLKEWNKESLYYRDHPRWLKELTVELRATPKLPQAVRDIRAQIDLELRDMLINQGLNTEQINKLMELPAEAVDIIDSEEGVMSWVRKLKNSRS